MADERDRHVCLLHEEKRKQRRLCSSRLSGRDRECAPASDMLQAAPAQATGQQGVERKGIEKSSSLD